MGPAFTTTLPPQWLSLRSRHEIKALVTYYVSGLGMLVDLLSYL
jgi:hypothetical protein